MTRPGLGESVAEVMILMTSEFLSISKCCILIHVVHPREVDKDHPVQQGRGISQLGDLWHKAKDLVFAYDQYLELIEEPMPTNQQKRKEREELLKK